MKNIFNKFDELKGANFVNIKGYTNSQGEVSDQLINANINVENAKKKDLETLKNFDLATLEVENVELAKQALNELIASAEKNLSDNRSKQSQAQSDAYISLGHGLKLNKENRTIKVSGMVINKTVITEGEEKKPVNSGEKTKLKNLIKRKADLRMNKYRYFTLDNIAEVAITGDTLQIKH